MKLLKEGLCENDADNSKTSDISEGNMAEGPAVNSSRKLRVTLQRIVAAEETTINLTAINADYSPTEAMNDLDSILDDEKFLDTLTEEPCSFEITDEGDDFNIQIIDNVDTANICESILTSAFLLWSNIKAAHWNAIGSNFFTLHKKLDEYNMQILEDIDFFGELAVELGYSAADPCILMKNAADADYIQKIDNTEGCTSDERFMYLRNTISAYVDAMEFYYVNLPQNVQSEIDVIIRYWRKEANYKLN